MKLRLNKITFTCFLIFVVSHSLLAQKNKSREIYQLTIYKYNTTEQEVILNNYCKDALLPTLHKIGYKNIGVFKSVANDTAVEKVMMIYLPITSLKKHLKLQKKLLEDKMYNTLGATYLNADYKNPPYSRQETILMQAFTLSPKMNLPNLKSAKKDRVYELRSYESATEKIFANKVHMFNEDDEIAIFKNINANAVFYAEVIAGSKMPNLMYLTCYENKTDRDEHWKSFGNHPAWKNLSAKPEYKNNVSHIDIYFLQPMEYSDF